MKHYYAIYPARNGLSVAHLGQANTFCEAEEFDVLQVARTDREAAIWISDLDDLMHLQKSIEVAREQN